jgi:hypothetical protein
MGSHDRSVQAFVDEIWRLTGERLVVRWRLWTGVYLEDEKTGAVYQIGGNKWQVLSPSQQESICRGLQRKDWVVLLGLRPIDDD